MTDDGSSGDDDEDGPDVPWAGSDGHDDGSPERGDDGPDIPWAESDDDEAADDTDDSPAGLGVDGPLDEDPGFYGMEVDERWPAGDEERGDEESGIPWTDALEEGSGDDGGGFARRNVFFVLFGTMFVGILGTAGFAFLTDASCKSGATDVEYLNDNPDEFEGERVVLSAHVHPCPGRGDRWIALEGQVTSERDASDRALAVMESAAQARNAHDRYCPDVEGRVTYRQTSAFDCVDDSEFYDTVAVLEDARLVG